MAIKKLEMHERIASMYDDGSMNVHPDEYSVERAQKDTWDKNEPNPAKQPKIALIGFHVKEILVDPEAIAAAEANNNSDQLLSDALDCLKGETPEDMTPDQATKLIIERITAVLRYGKAA